MTALSISKSEYHSQNALDIPELKHGEAGRLAATEAERLTALIDSLEGDDWEQPTDCSEWDVRNIVAHLAGAVAAQTSWVEFKRQNMSNPYMKEVEMKIDAINRRQVEDRSGATNEALAAEFRENAPKAVRTRQRLPWPVRQLRLPLGPPLGFASIGYMMDTIYTRDQWMHRHDIASATGKEMVTTAEHDGRLLALVVRDLGRKLKGQLQGRTVNLLLTGATGGSFSFGSKQQASASTEASIEMDVSTFNRLASGRVPVETAMAKATIKGDSDVANWFLNQVNVPY